VAFVPEESASELGCRTLASISLYVRANSLSILVNKEARSLLELFMRIQWYACEAATFCVLSYSALYRS